MGVRDFLNSQELRNALSGSLGLKATAVFIGVCNSILLAKLLGVTYYGVYVLILSSAQLALVPVTFGLPVLITRYFAAYQAKDDYGGMKGLFLRAHGFFLAMILLLALVLVLSVWLGIIPEDLKRLTVIGWLLVLVLGLNVLRGAAIRGLRYVVLGLLPELLIRNVLLLAALLTTLLLGYKMEPATALKLNLVCMTIAFVVGFVILKAKVGKQWKAIKARAPEPGWWKASLSYGSIAGVQQLKSKSPSFFLYFIMGLDAVAVFDVAMKASGLVSQLVDSVHAGLAPFISRFYMQKDITGLNRIIRKTVKFNTALSLPLFLIVALGGAWLLDLFFDPPFAVAYWPMVVLCMGSFYYAISGPVTPILNMTGHQLYLLRSQLVFTALLLLLLWPLILWLGVLGAASAYCLVWILQNSSLVVYIKSELGVNSTWY